MILWKVFNALRNVKYKIKNFFSKKMTFDAIKNNESIFLYAGDVPNIPQYIKYIGLSLWQNNQNHIKHDITNRHELPDNSVDIYQSEDVFEHIQYNMLPNVINDIYRILKPNGIFRLSVPDYVFDIFYERCQKDPYGEIQFDPGGGGKFVNGKVTNGGHLWFPKYKLVLDLLNKTNFKKIIFYHYYDENRKAVTHPIDYNIGYIQRTPDNDTRGQKPYRPMSIVVDCFK
jgi:SAM-dependent methyltransferase